jgi:hypothetical protein
MTETSPTHCSPSRKTSRSPRAPAGGRGPHRAWMEYSKPRPLGGGQPPPLRNAAIVITTSTISSWSSTRSAWGAWHVRASSASVEPIWAPQKQGATGTPGGRLDSPSRQRRAAWNFPSESQNGNAVGNASSQADADRQATIHSLASVCMRS